MMEEKLRRQSAEAKLNFTVEHVVSKSGCSRQELEAALYEIFSGYSQR